MNNGKNRLDKYVGLFCHILCDSSKYLSKENRPNLHGICQRNYRIFQGDKRIR